MATLLGLPHLHDGFFDGIRLSEDDCASLFVRTMNGESFTIFLSDVAALNLRNLRQGNIILDFVLISSDALSAQQINEAYGLEPQQEEMSQRLLETARQKGLYALEVSTSYGAEGTVLFRNAKVVPGHVLGQGQSAMVDNEGPHPAAPDD